MAMHYARLANPPRQQRVLRLLSSGREYSTRDIVQLAGVLAVNSIVSELRQNGVPVTCRRQKRVFFYRIGVKAA
jgi:hypothetical protein